MRGDVGVEVRCYCSDCKHNNQDGGCEEQYITINDDEMTSGGFYPQCKDYKEKE